MALYTIVRRRVVSQVQTDQVEAATEEEALAIVNKAQAEEQYDYANEWQTLDTVIEYPILDSDAILEVKDEFEKSHAPDCSYRCRGECDCFRSEVCSEVEEAE